MAVFSELGNGVYCVDALYVKPDVASIYLLQEADEVAIIETGTWHSMDNLLATMQQLGINDSQVRYVIPTHVHLDHAGGAGAMMARFDQASLIIHPRGARHMIDPQRLIEGTIAVYGQAQFERLYGQIEAIPEARIIIADDLERHSLHSRELLFIDTPGHAYHHFCIYDEGSRGIFTGDTFGISYAPMKQLPAGLIPTCPPSQFDPPAMRESISRLMQFEPQRLYLTHYGEFVDPAAHVQSFNRWIDDYLELCETLKPDDEAAEQRLQAELMTLVLDQLSNDATRAQLETILQGDIRLNAQGLAHWWRRSGHG